MRKLLLLGAIILVAFASTSIAQAEGYEVLNPACAEYLGQVIPNNVFQQWLQDGWIVPCDECEPAAPDPTTAPLPGTECHLMVWTCGPGCHYTDCVQGAGAISCWCEYSVLPPPSPQ